MGTLQAVEPALVERGEQSVEEDLVEDVLVEDSREVEKQPGQRQIISSQLQEATNLQIPNSQEVADVISQPSAEVGSQSKIPFPVC